MLIIGNSHVSIFDHGIECDQEQINIKYVGSLSIDWFYQQHPEAKKIYREFDLEMGWKILFIGNHDMYKLLTDAFENDVSEAFAAMLDKYKEVFVELNKNGKFAWAISMQQTNDIPVQFCTDKDFLLIVKEFNRQLTEWCLTQNIPVLDAISKISSPADLVEKNYLQADDLHLKPEFAYFYLDDISELSGLKLITGTVNYETDFPTDYEPGSFASLILKQLNLPVNRKLAPDINEFVSQVKQFSISLLVDKGIQIAPGSEEGVLSIEYFDSLSLVEIYSFASKMCGDSVDFEVDLHDFDTIDDLCTHLYEQWHLHPVYEDFVVSFTQPWNQNQQTLEAELRIMNIPAQLRDQFDEVVYTVTQGNVQYGMILFWQALMAKSDREHAKQLLNDAANSSIQFPIEAIRYAYYAKLLPAQDEKNDDNGIHYPEHVAYFDDKDVVQYQNREHNSDLKKLSPSLPAIKQKIIDGRYSEIEDIISDGLKKFPEYVDLIYLKALLCFEQQKIQEAEEYLNSLEKLWSYHAEGHLLKAELLFTKGQKESAKQALNYALQIDPKLMEVKVAELNQRGENFYEQGDLNSAKRSFEKALSIDEANVLTLNNLGALEANQNNLPTSFQYLFEAYKIDPENRDVVINIVDVLGGLNREKDAEEILTLYLNLHPEDQEIQDRFKSQKIITFEQKTGQPERPGGFISEIDPNALKNYFQPPSGNTERFINVSPIEVVGATLSAHQALKNYEISDIGVGLTVVNAVFNHIVVNKLQGAAGREVASWHEMVVVPIRCDISDREKNTRFDISVPNSLKDISEEFYSLEDEQRRCCIENYATELRNGNSLGRPLYVSGQVLNNMGASTDSHAIYMIDGARRITASALVHVQSIEVLLILSEQEFQDLLNTESKRVLKQTVQKIGWFSSYQSIPLVDLQGERGLQRFNLMDLGLLKDQTVMDFGCNLGQSSIKAVLSGAKQVWGVEGFKETYQAAQTIKNLTGFENLDYLNVNFNDPQFAEIIDQQCSGQVDYAFFFSVYRTKELTQREKLFHYIIDKVTKGIFFEGHAHPVIDSPEYHDWLFECYELESTFLGFSEENCRPLYFLTKKNQQTNKAFPERNITDDNTIAVVVNLVPTEDRSWLERQETCIKSLNDILPRQKLIPVNLCYQDEILQPDGWVVLPELIKSANEMLAIPNGKRKPFVNDLFSISASWCNQNSVKWFCYINNDIFLTEELIQSVKELFAQGFETVCASRTEIIKQQTTGEFAQGPVEYTGFDTFFVQVEWWQRNQDLFQNYILGERAWDDAYAAIMMCHSKGKIIYQPGLSFHLKHETSWLDGHYSDYNLELYNSIDLEYQCRFRSFIRDIQSKDINTLSESDIDSLSNSYFKYEKPTGYVNIGMITYNRLEYTKQAIQSIIRYTKYPFALTVIDNNSSDGTQEFLKSLKLRNEIKNLVLLKENIGVAKASNFAWQCEPDASYYLKYDNDIIIQKPDWLKKLVEVANGVNQLGVVGYNFEPVSYELKEIDGFKIRPKHQGANVGGACVLIPKKTQNRLGFWCEDYGLYGEEDYDYGIRVTLSGLLNVYMEDEDIGFHLPAGKAAAIDQLSFVAKDGLEESLDKAYREAKDAHRAKNMAPDGPFQKNLQAYQNYPDRLYVATNGLANNAFSLVLPESLKATILKFQEKRDPEYPIIPVPNKIIESAQAKLKIAVLSIDYTKHACAFIRIQSIFQSLSDQISYRQIVNSHGDVDETVIKWADVIIIQRIAPRRESQELLDEIFASGCCVIYETDDLFTEKLPDTNYLSSALEEHIPYIVDVAQRADLITTSTVFLAEELSQYNTNAQVLPNLIDHRLWLKQQPAIVKNVQTIVYAGTQTHAADLECIENSLLKIHEKHQGRIKFIFIGCSTPNLRKLPGTEYYELVPYREYSALVQKLSVDIAIIPLLDGQFNNCKSNIKWLEYSMCGIAGVYSNVLPYQCIQEGKTGLLANNNEDDWFKKLEWLIDNPEKRIEIAQAAQQQVIEKYTLATEADRYFQTWMFLRNSKQKPLEQKLITCTPEIGNIHSDDQDYLQQLSFASGLESACQVLITIAEITDDSIYNTAVIASASNSKFLSKYAVTKDELFLQLAEIVKDKAIEKVEHDLGLLNQAIHFLYAIDHKSVYFEKSISLKATVRQLIDDLQYQYWIINHSLLEVDAELFAERMMLKWQNKPSFHLLMLLFPEEQALLADTLDSLGKQFYQEWGLTVISELPVPDPIFEQEDFLNWVQVGGNDNPYELLNALISDVESDWVAIIDPGAAFEQQTFIQIADYIDIRPKWKLIYTDEDSLEKDEAGKEIRTAAKFKPDFNLDLLRSTPYMGRFCVVERAGLLEIGGFSSDFGLENYDAVFRIYENYGEQSVGHISDILFHQPGTSIRRVTDKQIQNIVKRHLQRNSIDADVGAGYLPESCRVTYQHQQVPKVSIIIPTKDKLEYLEPCIESLLEKTEYPNYEVIIVDNQSSDPDVVEYYSALKQRYSEKMRVIDYPHAFNFSAICNYAADQADGEYLLLLNNDTEVLHKEWLGRMMMHAMRDDVGVVGARLVYPETGLLQHAGIVMGMDTIADHPFIGQLHIKEPGYMGRALLDQNYSAVTGACLLIEKNIYQTVNGMDEEKFAVSYNDVDLCLKTCEAGYRVVWTPYATLVHHGNVTQNSTAVSKEKIERFKSEREAMFKKWQATISDDPAFNRQLSLTKRDFSIEAAMPCNWDVNFHDRLRVFGIPIEGGAGDYRLIQPFNGLRKSGFAQCEYLRLQKGDKDSISVSEIARQKPDVVVFHSTITDKNLELLEQCKTLLPDIFLIYMIDDLVDQVPEKSSAYRTIKRSFRDAKPRIRRALSNCDRVIVSTEPLAKFCHGMIDDIRIVPNSLQRDVWLGLESKRQQGNKLRVGWAGALQHQGDLEMIVEVVKQTAKDVDWIFMGMCPESIKPYIKEFQEAVDISDYPKVLAGLNLDLAIAPLEDNRFNEAKSNLRILEYGILGWPVICSDVYPYRGAPVTCVKNTTESWLAAIRQAINSPDNLPKQGDTLCQWVTTNYFLEDNLDRWLEALKPES